MELHNKLGLRIVEKVKNIITRGYDETVKLTEDLYPYFVQMCDSYGSCILSQIATDLNEDLINREEFNEWKNKLNIKSLNFIKTNIEIYKEAKKQIFEISFIKSIDNIFDDVKKNLLDKNIIKPIDTINEISDKTLTFELNEKSLLMLEKNTITHDINNFNFKNLLDKKNLHELNACGSCLVSVGHITNKNDLINIGTGIIGACNIGNAIQSMLSSGSLGPFGIASAILSGIAMIFQTFKKNKNDNQLQNFLINLSKFLCQMRNEMHECFNNIENILNEQQQLYLNNFYQIHSNVNLIQDMLEYTNLNILIIEEKINTIHENINVQFDKIINIMTFDKIIIERERIAREISVIKISENFNENLQNIISNISNTNEAMSGYYRIELFKDRVNLGSEFNINSAVQIVSNIFNQENNIEHLQNPLLFSLLLNILMDKINEQKHDEHFIEGFISFKIYHELLNILNQMYKYYDFVKMCRTPKLYESLTIEHNNKLQTLNNAIENYYKQKYDLEYEKLLLKVKKNYIRETTNLMNTYENQKINIKKSYSNNWFQRNSHHVAGKFSCGERRLWDI